MSTSDTLPVLLRSEAEVDELLAEYHRSVSKAEPITQSMLTRVVEITDTNHAGWRTERFTRRTNGWRWRRFVRPVQRRSCRARAPHTLRPRAAGPAR